MTNARFDRVPATAADRTDEERATRREILSYWASRYGVPKTTFTGYTFWERGKGKIWVYGGDPPDPVRIEGLGMTFLRTRREHWKPTTDAVQRFGGRATRNVLHLAEPAARAFLAGEDQQIPWDGDWGYLVVTHTIAGRVEPVGVGLYLHGELRSQIPKGRRRDL